MSNLRLATLLPDAFILTTQRLQLRPLAMNDVDIVWHHCKNPEIPRYMAWAPHKSIADTEAFVTGAVARMAKREVLHWCIWRGEEFCGLFSIIDIRITHLALIYDQGELGYWCTPEAQGQGVMTEAGKAVIGFAFDTAGFHKLTVAHWVQNDASRKLIERMGFNFVGIQREHYYKDKKWQDQRIYELLADDYQRKTA